MATSTVAKRCFRMICPSRHVWIEMISKSSTHRWVQIGLTERGIEDIGDVSSIQSFIHPGQCITRGQEIVKIHFEGHAITAADELYHTVWETFEGQLAVVSPVSGTVLEQQNEIESDLQEEEEIDSDTVLAALMITGDEWKQTCRETQLVNEQQYQILIQNMTRGKFAEQ
ncbi:hypothetical protein IV203_029942 [Nitzschia inconspicua]|uniref:Uncharacterized protein n=1 Tax=Nitzschia inconspicua TaxID=303405 RepID=A0A9K3Q1G1_9STRA|nr:hypothetical protein IV203_029942 [Nitzschia inconspicua]